MELIFANTWLISFPELWPRPSAAAVVSLDASPSFAFVAFRLERRLVQTLRRPWRHSAGQPRALGRLRLLLFGRGSQTGAPHARTPMDAGNTALGRAAPTLVLPGQQLWLTSARAALPPGEGRSVQARARWRGVGGSWRPAIANAWLLRTLAAGTAVSALLKLALAAISSFLILHHFLLRPRAAAEPSPGSRAPPPPPQTVAAVDETFSSSQGERGRTGTSANQVHARRV